MKDTARSLSRGRRKVAQACLVLTHVERISRRPSVSKSLPSEKFAIPETRQFPIHDEGHAKMAIAHLLRQAGLYGPKPELARRVLAAIKRQWPAVYRCERSRLVKDAKNAHRIRLVPRPRSTGKRKGQR
jgi:hypothetical protein